ncbi:MAG TPA: methylmalonyl-CoA epimerase [Miltoncostaeaceae bacterium]|nr:methylmalonyl-CoA epimerase [Miltoncostaeaceae bacterium]
MLGRIHHVAYVVADMDAALERLGATFGLRPALREVMADQGVEAALCGPAGAAVELIRPLDADGAIARFLDARGEGLHHVAFEVDDLDAALADLRARGAELIDERPRHGLGGHRVAFVHPRSANGVLTELVEAEGGGGH